MNLWQIFLSTLINRKWSWKRHHSLNNKCHSITYCQLGSRGTYFHNGSSISINSLIMIIHRERLCLLNTDSILWPYLRGGSRVGIALCANIHTWKGICSRTLVALTLIWVRVRIQLQRFPIENSLETPLGSKRYLNLFNHGSVYPLLTLIWSFWWPKAKRDRQ